MYYSDTDSLFLSKELDLNLIGKELGQFKLEHFFKEIVFLSAKCYAGLTVDGNYICKIKGYKNANDISFDVLKSLLKENSSLNLKHVKWFKNISKGEIIMKEELYELIKSTSKREIIYENGVAVNTRPFKLNNNILIPYLRDFKN